jgi:tetratricopeptide (TPR) repeat protein
VSNPRDIVADIRGVPLRLRMAIVDPMRFNVVVNVLVSLSLLTRDEDTGLLRIHRLVQEILRDEMTARQKRRWIERGAHFLAEQRGSADFGLLFPHIDAVVGHAEEVRPLRTVVVLSNWTATQLMLRGELEAATAWQQRALLMAEDVGPPSLVVDMKINLANHFRYQGRFDEAREIEEWVLNYSEYHGYRTYEEILEAKNNLAITLHFQGEFEASRRLDEEVLAARIQYLGENHPHTLMSMNNLALTLTALGRHDEAEQLIDDVVARHGDDPQKWQALGNKALILRNRGQLDLALALQREVLEAVRGIVGDEHPNTYKMMNNLGVILTRKGTLDEAEVLFQAALAGRVQVLGTRHPDTRDTARHLEEIRAGRDG